MSTLSSHNVVLFVDDDVNLLEGLVRLFRREPFDVQACSTIESARERVGRGGVDVVVCDEHLPGASGAEFLSELHRTHPSTIRIMLAGSATVGSAARAVNGGQIFRFLVKPCARHELLDTLHQAIDHKLLMDRCRAALQLLQRQNDFLQVLTQTNPDVSTEVRQAIARSAHATQLLQQPEEEIEARIDVEISRGKTAIQGESPPG